jgi:glycosyltransferase involved in cell wall biosynthesis
MKIAIVIPCYRVRAHILEVLAGIGPEAARIYVVDDLCPEHSGELVRTECRDPRVEVLRNPKNLGVGGATIAGYRRALADGADIVVKLDGDGQMDAAAVSCLIEPIRRGAADYCKGNRFYHPGGLKDMPPVRLLGNAVLSFVNKLVNGYWQVMDPTNGFTAIHAAVLRLLPLDRLDNGYFFESDMLFRLSTVRAVVTDIPMAVRYGSENSGLSVWGSLLDFPLKYGIRILKRIAYNYYLRDFNAGSLAACGKSPYA